MPKNKGIAKDFRIAKSGTPSTKLTPRQAKMRALINNPARTATKAGTVTKSKGRTGGTDVAKDRKLSAKPSGYRISRNGKLYYEGRKNRSDSGKV